MPRKKKVFATDAERKQHAEERRARRTKKARPHAKKTINADAREKSRLERVLVKRLEKVHDAEHKIDEHKKRLKGRGTDAVSSAVT